MCQKWFGVSFLELFTEPILDRFKQRDFPQRYWSPFQKRHSSFEPIRNERSVIRSKSLSYTRIPQKTENLSKMVRGALFRAFCSQYQIVLSKETFLQDIGHPFRRGTVHLNQFGQEIRPYDKLSLVMNVPGFKYTRVLKCL